MQNLWQAWLRLFYIQVHATRQIRCSKYCNSIYTVSPLLVNIQRYSVWTYALVISWIIYRRELLTSWSRFESVRVICVCAICYRGHAPAFLYGECQSHELEDQDRATRKRVSQTFMITGIFTCHKLNEAKTYVCVCVCVCVSMGTRLRVFVNVCVSEWVSEWVRVVNQTRLL